jgi:hypothetical protein
MVLKPRQRDGSVQVTARWRAPSQAPSLAGVGELNCSSAVHTNAPDYYQVLGVPSDASQDDIKRAYRKLDRAQLGDCVARLSQRLSPSDRMLRGDYNYVTADGGPT